AVLPRDFAPAIHRVGINCSIVFVTGRLHIRTNNHLLLARTYRYRPVNQRGQHLISALIGGYIKSGAQYGNICSFSADQEWMISAMGYFEIGFTLQRQLSGAVTERSKLKRTIRVEPDVAALRHYHVCYTSLWCDECSGRRARRISRVEFKGHGPVR